MSATLHEITFELFGGLNDILSLRSKSNCSTTDCSITAEFLTPHSQIESDNPLSSSPTLAQPLVEFESTPKPAMKRMVEPSPESETSSPKRSKSSTSQPLMSITPFAGVNILVGFVKEKLAGGTAGSPKVNRKSENLLELVFEHMFSLDVEIRPTYNQGRLLDAHKTERMKFEVESTKEQINPNIDLNILRVNKQLHRLASKIFYGKHFFVFEDGDKCQWWLDRIGTNLEAVRKLALHMHHGFKYPQNFVRDDAVSIEERWSLVLDWLFPRQKLLQLRIRFVGWTSITYATCDEWVVAGTQYLEDKLNAESVTFPNGKIQWRYTWDEAAELGKKHGKSMESAIGDAWRIGAARDRIVSRMTKFRGITVVNVEQENCAFMSQLERSSLALCMKQRPRS